jgi:hypothetical protein
VLTPFSVGPRQFGQLSANTTVVASINALVTEIHVRIQRLLEGQVPRICCHKKTPQSHMKK